MAYLDDFATIELIKQEYKKTFLLNLFRKYCVRLGKDEALKNKVMNIYRQSPNKRLTTSVLIKDEFDYDMAEDEADQMSVWIQAYLHKNKNRKPISLDTKKSLYHQQKGKCMLCGEGLGTDWSKMHVDHIVPFKLVGDELEGNYQLLCCTCNESKSASVDYIFKSLIHLV